MPEGHILHRLARLHHRRFAGSPVRVLSPQGRFAEGAAMVDGRVLVKSEAWGKHDHGEPSYATNRPRTYVYRRVGSECRICGTPVAHSVMKGRNLFWCPECQVA